jgi:FkbM family methyltransferase
MEIRSRLIYYARSIPTLLGQVSNWYALPILLWRKRPLTIRLRNGLHFQVRSLMDAWIIKETCLDRDYERHGTEIQDGWTIIDIGAGLGDFTIFAATKNPHGVVYAFEPFPESFSLLQNNLALNGINNVKSFPRAVGAASGQLTLTPLGAAVQHTTVAGNQAQAGSELLTVDALSLEELFRSNGIVRCDYLKLDCEGSEFDILLNAGEETLACIQHICLEYHNHVTRYSDVNLVRHLQQHRFQVHTTPNPVHAHLGFLYAYRLNDV